jgi:hypothetical protein
MVYCNDLSVHLSSLGYTPEEINCVNSNLKLINTNLIFGSLESGVVKEAKENIISIEKKYGLDSYHHTSPVFPPQIFLPGIEKIISESIEDKTNYSIGFCGVPASGKTTILNYLQKLFGENIVIIDEFWDRCPGYEEKKNLLTKKNIKKPHVVAAGHFEDAPDITIHLSQDAEIRLANLKKRKRNHTDDIRAKNFDIFQVIDFYYYAINGISADFFLETSNIKY